MEHNKQRQLIGRHTKPNEASNQHDDTYDSQNTNNNEKNKINYLVRTSNISEEIHGRLIFKELKCLLYIGSQKFIT